MTRTPRPARWRLTGLAAVLATTAVVVTAGAAPADQRSWPAAAPGQGSGGEGGSGAGAGSPCPPGTIPSAGLGPAARSWSPQRQSSQLRAPLPGDRPAVRSAIEPPASSTAAPVPGSPTTPGPAQAPATSATASPPPSATSSAPATTTPAPSATSSTAATPPPATPPPTSAPPPSTTPSPPPCLPIGPEAGITAAIQLRHDVRTTSTIRKLGSDLVTTPGVMNTTVNLATGKLTGTLAIPPSRSYFVVLGFVPSTAVVEFEPVGPAAGTLPNGKLDITLNIRLRLRDVRQAGVPMEVGENCRTERPMVIRLFGDLPILPNTDYRYTSEFEIPPFAGCGVRENLDPLFSGLVAGPGNRLVTVLRLRS